MDDTTPGLGHNSPPSDPVSDATAPWQDDLAEAEIWLNGEPVETDAQLVEAERLLASAKEAAKAHTAGLEAASKPLYEAWQAAREPWAATGKRIDAIVAGLKASITDIKKRRAAKAEAERQAAWRAAEHARLAAERANTAADPTDLASVQTAENATAAMKQAQADLRAADNRTERGMRTVQVTEVVNIVEWARIAWRDHRAEYEQWLRELANTHRPNIPGVVETRKEKVVR